MKKIIRYPGVILCILLFLSCALQAQIKPGVLHLKNNDYNSYFDLGIDLKKDLLEPGNAGEATLEFWIKSTAAGNQWTISDLSETNGFNLSMSDENKLDFNGFEVNTASLTASDLWHHVAITFQAGKANVYLNGNQVITGRDLITHVSAVNLHLFKTAGTQVLLTELRGWSRNRTGEEVLLNQWRSYIYDSDFELADLKTQEGLEVIFGTSAKQLTSNAELPLETVKWTSLSGSANGLLSKNGKGIASADGLGEFISISDEIDHPILGNQNIFLRASKGEFDNRIELEWPHITNVDGYNIYKNRTLINTIQNVKIRVSELISFEDESVLPGELYTYRVEGYSNEDDAFRPDGQASGFIFPNGRIEGNVKTESEIFVENVRVNVTPENGSVPGSGLMFQSGSEAIDIRQIQAFRDNADFTLEFWYKSDNSNQNVVFSLGQMAVLASNAQISVKTNEISVINADISDSDDLWHHIAIVYSGTVKQIYRDGEIKASVNNTSQLSLSAYNQFSFNENAVTEYQLDEIRVWAGVRNSEDIMANYQHILSGREEQLMLYYRLDMKDGSSIYNQAINTKGAYAGASNGELNWLNAEEQPDIVYGTYSDSGGNYNMEGINMGSDADGLTFITELSKPNHIFNPPLRENQLRRSLERDDYAKEADFIDISSLPISGKVLYSENGEIYPALQGLQFTIDGNIIQGADKNLVTDNAGVFSIGAPLGKHTIAVSNPLQEISPGTQSLSFDGVDDYAVMESLFDYKKDGVWSGWLKKSVSENASQVIMQIGDVKLVLKNNNKLVLDVESTEILSTSNTVDDEWNFFSVTFEEATQKVKLYVNDISEEVVLENEVSLNGKVMLGAGNPTNPADFYAGNLYLVEYRGEFLVDAAIENLRNGGFYKDDKLLISYNFSETNQASIRTNSNTLNAQDYVMNLNGPVLDGENIHTYTRKFKYTYKAEGPLADVEDDSQFDFNVINPVTDLKFYNETRFGFVGNLVIPCGFNIGGWDVEVKRTDILSPEFIMKFTGDEAEDLFNNDHTVFSVPNLIPGKYKVFITNKADASIQLETPIIDITNGWASYDFEYRSPLQLSVNVFAEIDSISQIIESGVSVIRAPFVTLTSSCESLVFEQGRGYLTSIEAFEKYGVNGDEKCYAKDVSYKFSGDMARVVAKTIDTGKDSIVFQALNPNFKGDFKRSLSITATSEGRNKTEVLSGYVTGAQQFNTDFTLEAPPKILAVVHDPAGDGSSATLSKGVSFDFTENVSHSGGLDISIDFSTGLDKEYFTGFWAGVGGGALFMEKVVDTETKNKISISESFRFGSASSKSSSVTLNQSISTSSAGDVPGIASDVYVGYTPIIHLGKGSRLEMVNCEPVFSENIDVMRPDRSPLFSVTHQHIKDVIIPNLIRLKSVATDDQDYYEEQITEWRQIIADNESLVADANSLSRFEIDNPNPYVVQDSIVGQDAFGGDVYHVESKVYFPESIAFSAGQTLSYSLTDKSGSSSSDNQSSNTGIKKDFGTSFTVFGAKVNLKSTVNAVYNYDASQSDSEGEESTYSFTLTDGDIGDQFDILVKKDKSHTYATPVFKTEAGRSMCPYEVGTQSREGVEIAMQAGESAFGEGDLDDRITFKVELRNTQVAPESAGNGYYKTYNVKAYNRKGAIVRLNGSLLGESGTSVVLEPEGPESIKDAVISIARNPDSPELVDFDDISIVMYSPCEEGGGSLGFFNAEEAGVELADTLYVSAKFHRPCVEEIQVISPQPYWVVNRGSNDALPFEFKINNAEASFDELIVEYADPESNAGEILEVVSYASLQQTADTIGGNIIYSFLQDVSGLTDGKYKFRMVPKCGAGTEEWRSRTATDWIVGSIYRSNPIITEVTPSENTILSEGLITATYDRPIAPNGVNSLNVSLRGILGGKEYVPYSANFNNGADSIGIPHNELISLDSAYTIEFWLKVNTIPDSEVNIISKGGNYAVSLNSAGKINNGRALSSSLEINDWVHVAVVYDGNHNIKTYFDGQIVSDLNQVVPFSMNTIPVTIGGDGFTGQIDEIRIWNSPRSQADLVTYQEDRLLGNEIGLKAYYVLDSIALAGEAVRDFTGNTSGTTSNSISWIKAGNAAPIKVEKVIQDVPIDVILSGERQVIINPKSNFPAYYLEGAQLTAFITDQSIEDVYGNKAPGKSWHFVIDRNAVRWSKNNYSLFQNEGNGQEFSLEIFNEGASNATYELTDLPDWLQVIGKKEGIQYDLPYGFTNGVTFKTADWMSPGIYSSHIKTITYGADGARTGLESFYLELEVLCPAPDHSFDSNQYAEQMLILAQLSVNGDISFDENDVVAAYVGEEVRGFASPVVSDGVTLIQMTVYGASSETASLKFRIWDASDCREFFGISESYTFSSGSSLGSSTSPVTFTASSVQINQISLSQGYNWVSFNQHDLGQSNLSLSAIAGLTSGDVILSQSGETASYLGGNSWSGSLTSIDPKQSYLIESAMNTNISVTGELVNLNTNIPVVSGVNWVSYLPNTSMEIERAFVSLEGGPDFTVIGKGEYAEYSSDGWAGSLTSLTPGNGYRIVSSQDDVLNYTGNTNNVSNRNAEIGDPMEISEQMNEFGWELDNVQEADLMYITSALEGDGIDPSVNYLIGAFVSGKLKGVGIPQKIDNEYRYFMVIYGDELSNDSLEFKIVDKSGSLRKLSNKLKFVQNKAVGNYQNPYQLNLLNGLADGYDLGQNYPNPVIDETVINYLLPKQGVTRLIIYDQSGRKIKVLVDQLQEKGSYELHLNVKGESNIKRGVYFYELNHGGNRVVRKMIVK